MTTCTHPAAIIRRMPTTLHTWQVIVGTTVVAVEATALRARRAAAALGLTVARVLH